MKTKLLITTACSLLLTTHQVIAQTNEIDLTIYPPTQFIELEKDQQKTYTIELTQNGNLPLEVTPHIVDFIPDGETGNPQLQGTSSVDFIKITNPNISFDRPFQLQPNTTTKININIDPNDNNIEKEYLNTIVFETRPSSQTSIIQTGTKTSAIIASNLIIYVGDFSNYTGEIYIKNLETASLVESFRPIKFSAIAFNDNPKSVPLSGKAKIYDWQMNQLAEYELYSDIVLGKSSRLIRHKNDIDQSLSSEFMYEEPFLFGPYTIEIELTNPDPNIQQTFTIRKRVLALPYSILIMIMIATTGYVLYRYILVKKVRY